MVQLSYFKGPHCDLPLANEKRKGTASYSSGQVFEGKKRMFVSQK